MFADDVIMIKDGRIMAGGVKEAVMTEENISALYDMDIQKLRHNTEIFFTPMDKFFNIRL
jgi:ABC-type cobalamin/Fe3+-siderophores transport system ATPase subunit